jgi:hypothetical protein
VLKNSTRVEDSEESPPIGGSSSAASCARPYLLGGLLYLIQTSEPYGRWVQGCKEMRREEIEGERGCFEAWFLAGKIIKAPFTIK